MLKTLIFFLFGCSLYFGQISATSIPTLEGDGTKVKSSSGQGSGTDPFGIMINQSAKNDLNIYLMPAEVQFTKYTIYDLSGNLKKTQQISPTNSYSIDVSNLAPGNYLIKVEAVSPSAIVTKLFVRI